MFDFGFSELLIVGVVSLIVVGPKDLPVMFRNVGRVMGKARGMAREFSRAMDAAADEVGVKEINKTLKAASNPKAYGLDKLREASGIDELDASVRSSVSVSSKAGDKGAKAALPKPSAHAPGSDTAALSANRAEDR
ncbi:MAG: twin-arginine translocase subunit TatB, partial [Rubellimicrobium sp.]|nr:twin-arginine translocase subunit TatB [Rubellimicrobium sp.]